VSYESEREERAVGPALCNDCGHAIRLHGPDGCEFERTVQVEGSSETMSGPCGCSALTLESDGSVSTAEIYRRAGVLFNSIANRPSHCDALDIYLERLWKRTQERA